MLNDLSLMPFGRFAGTKMENVPASYLHYLWTKADFNKINLTKGEPEKQHQKNSFFVAKYISERLSALKEESEDSLIWQ